MVYVVLRWHQFNLDLQDKYTLACEKSAACCRVCTLRASYNENKRSVWTREKSAVVLWIVNKSRPLNQYSSNIEHYQRKLCVMRKASPLCNSLKKSQRCEVLSRFSKVMILYEVFRFEKKLLLVVIHLTAERSGKQWWRNCYFYF